jgi:transcription termination factor Rho
MPVLTRSALEDSPLADLHELAKELSIDAFRKLRKGDLVDAILLRQGEADEPEGAAPPALEAGTDADAEAGVAPEDAEDEERPRRRSRRGGRSRVRSRDEDTGDADTPDALPVPHAIPADEDAPALEAAPDAEDATAPADVAPEVEEATRPRSRRARVSRSRDDLDGGDGQEGREPAEDAEPVVTGVVEILGNGSGFLRVAGGEASDDDAYISAAQIRRCELVSGDRVSGPVRPPRRSERYPSMVRIDTINDRPPTRWPRARRSTSCPPRSPRSASRSARRTRRSRRSSGSPRSARARA